MSPTTKLYNRVKPISNKNKQAQVRGWRYSPEVENVLSLCVTLGLVPSVTIITRTENQMLDAWLKVCGFFCLIDCSFHFLRQSLL